MSSSHCGHCQHIVKGNVHTCPMCGGTMNHQTKNEERHCPRCKDRLEVHHYNGYQLDQCVNCQGLWVEPQEFKVLTNELDVYRDESSEPNYIKKPLPRAEGYLPCACCSQLMTRQNFKAISGVIIDLCINCGVWLDQGELKQIRSFIASGGLDKAQDRQLSKNKQHLEQLDDRVSDLELMEKMLHKTSIKRILFRGF